MTVKTPHGSFSKGWRVPIYGVSLFRVKWDWNHGQGVGPHDGRRLMPGDIYVRWHRRPLDQLLIKPYLPFGDYLGTYLLDGREVRLNTKGDCIISCVEIPPDEVVCE